mgnify:FL=1
MLKILRIVTAVAFCLAVSVFALFYINEKKNTDNTVPVIEIEDRDIEVSIDATEKDLLKGVTAYDEKDGDNTSHIVVESVSQFIEEGVCIVKYAVSDSDNHVVKDTRTIRYVDYTSPRFTMERSMVFNVGEDIDVLEVVGAVDSIDGDISEKVVIMATDYKTDTLGTFKISFQATNSKGDIIYLDLPMHIEESSILCPDVELRDYIIYVKKGEKPDFSEYVKEVTTIGGSSVGYDLKISTNFDSEKPGIYSVDYYVVDEAGYTTHSVLTVVVEE